MAVLIDTNLKTRVMLKKALNKPIQVMFVCHEPAMWSMFESVYQAMDADECFAPVVVTLPYRSGSLPAGQRKDAGMFEFCKTRGIRAIRGYDKEKDEWLNPASFIPDYVFFQTPYDIYVPMWSVEQVSIIAKVCYIPYATCLAKGEVDNIVNPTSFFRFASFIFKESLFSKDLFFNKFERQNWLKEERVIVCGHPKLDYLTKQNELHGKVWKRPVHKNIKRILWTPRWTTSDDTSTFFDYKDYFVEFCKGHPNIDFVFRPHPLCFQNFIKTGELTARDLERMELVYENSLNMILDRTSDYQDTFLTSDILVSDISSLLLEYLATGKPIIYTHRTGQF